MDLVGTCPQSFWQEWLDEGDCAGDPPTGQEYAWFTSAPIAAQIMPGDRFYVVAHGRLRGYATVTHVRGYRGVSMAPGGRARLKRSWAIVRGAGAVACTIPEPIPGFRGLRARWWDRDQETEFPDWRDP